MLNLELKLAQLNAIFDSTVVQQYLEMQKVNLSMHTKCQHTT